jgi:signal transduction histidine kinase
MRVVQRFRRRLGVRMRSALAAALVVAAASVLTGVALVIAAHYILLDNVNQNATQRADQIAGQLALSGPAALAAAIHPSPRDRTVVQVVDADGRVLAASVAVRGAEPIAPLRPPPGQTEGEQRRLAVSHNDLFQVVAETVNTSDGPLTVLVAQSLDEVDDGTEAATAALLVGLPLLTLVVGAATFLFVGRTLRPVEAMRRQADTITARSLETRLPVPAADDEIAALANTMNTMLDRIEAATTAQRRFVADASHELRSPLTTIHMGLDLLGRTDPSVARMRRESARMGRLIDDLLLLARVDESGLKLRCEDLDLDDVLYAERDRITAQRPDLEVRTKVTPVRVSGDPHHVQRAARNLVDNAVRHARTAITLSLTGNGTRAELTVADDGPGIPREARERVFDRFVRLDEDRARTAGGAGLGLPIARDIVAAHGGTLTLDDAPGGGTAAKISLPYPPSGSSR